MLGTSREGRFLLDVGTSREGRFLLDVGCLARRQVLVNLDVGSLAQCHFLLAASLTQRPAGSCWMLGLVIVMTFEVCFRNELNFFRTFKLYFLRD